MTFSGRGARGVPRSFTSLRFLAFPVKPDGILLGLHHTIGPPLLGLHHSPLLASSSRLPSHHCWLHHQAGMMRGPAPPHAAGRPGRNPNAPPPPAGDPPAARQPLYRPRRPRSTDPGPDDRHGPTSGPSLASGASGTSSPAGSDRTGNTTRGTPNTATNAASSAAAQSATRAPIPPGRSSVSSCPAIRSHSDRPAPTSPVTAPDPLRLLLVLLIAIAIAIAIASASCP